MNHSSDEVPELAAPPGECIGSHPPEENSGVILDMRVTTKRDDGEDGDHGRPQVENGRQDVENVRPAVENGCPVRASRGRRKQRKPVRLRLDETMIDIDFQEKFFYEICENNELLVRGGGVGEDGKQSSWKISAEEGQAENGIKESTASANEGGAGVGFSEEQFVCPECGHSETTRAELGRHLLEAHLVSTVEKPVDRYPTKYHRLGNEFREASFQFGRHLTRISEKQLTSTKKEQELGSEESLKSPFPAEVSMSSTKAPEREMELSSSRHGVKIHHQHHHHHHQQQQQHHNSGSIRFGGSVGGTSSSTSSRSPVQLDLSPLDLIAPSRIQPPDGLQHPQHQPRDSYPLAQPPIPIPLSQTPKPVSMIAAPSIPSALSFATAGICISSSGSCLLSSSSSTFSSARNSVNSSAGGDTEDYCNRCQKHFCNKYYLRKHKQDVHGVGPGAGNAQNSQQMIDGHILPPLPPPQPSSSSDVCLSTNSLGGTDSSSSGQTPIGQRLATTLANHSMLPFSPIITSLPFVLPFPSGPVTNSIILQQPPITSSPSFLGTTVIPGFPSLPSLMFLNPFASPLTILKTAPPFLQAANDNSNFASSSLNTLAELQNIENSVSDTHASVKNSILPTTGFSGGGGDQTAHCELCRKEFCNTYFLKVHKREKHGIPLDEGDASLFSKRQQATLGLLDGVRFSGSGEAEPGENLIVKNSALSLKLPEDPFASQSDRNEDTLCRLCKKQLSNRYSLMMHLLTTHSIKPEGFGLASELLQLDTMNRAMAAAAAAAAAVASTASSDSSKLSDRVACDICNKEVCNKYFLKTHKIKVHGLDSSLGVDGGFRDGLTAAANESLLQDIRPLLHLDHLSQKHEDIAKTFMNIAAEIGLKNAVNELKREQKNQLDKDQLNLLSVDKSSLKIAGRKDTCKDDLSTAISLIAKNSYSMAQLEPACRENKVKSTGQGNHPGSAGGDLFKHSSSGKHSGHEKSKRSWSGGKHSSKEGKGVSNKPSEEVLKKSGIDPEAYCEICKKEFCSKYFLKTHKHKTHGVKSDPGMEAKPALPTPLQGFSGAVVASAAIAQSAAMTGAVFEGAGDRRSSEISESSAAAQKTTREGSGNGARVTCEVCSKALCNKYFLKTHMLKIHGSSVDAAGSAAAPAAPAAGGEIGEGGRAKPDSVSAKDCSSSTDVVATSTGPTTASEEQPATRPSPRPHSPPPSLPAFGSTAKDHPDPTEPKTKEADDSRDQTETESWLRPTTNDAAQVWHTSSAKDAVPCSAASATGYPNQGSDSALNAETTDGRIDSEDEEVRAKADWIREPDLPKLDASDGFPPHPDDLQPPKLVREEGVFEPLDTPPKEDGLTRQDQPCSITAAGSQHSDVQVDSSTSEKNHGNGILFGGEGSTQGPTVQSMDSASSNEPPTSDCSRLSGENGAGTPHRRRGHRKRCHAPPSDKPKNETSCKKIKHDEDENNEVKDDTEDEEARQQGLLGAKGGGGQRSAEEDVTLEMDVDRELEVQPQHLKDSSSDPIVASDDCVSHQLVACAVVGSVSVEPGITTTPISCSSSSSCSSASSSSASSSSSSSFTSCNVYLPSSVQQIREPLATLACTSTTSVD